MPAEKAEPALVLFGKGESADVFKLDAAGAPASVQTIAAKQGDLIFAAATVGKTVLVLTAPDYSKFSMAAQSFQWNGSALAAGATANLASMAENDDATVADIRKFITDTLAKENISAPADMKAYTNTIPGTKVDYDDGADPGGKFMMGSPEAEKGRGRRRAAARGEDRAVLDGQVRGHLERVRAVHVSRRREEARAIRHDPAAERDKVADAVARPTKPYIEMSFGMGKDGFPAISMTQHAANKYCHWLRPRPATSTACPPRRNGNTPAAPGTTTAYSFGDDPAKLGDYAWFEEQRRKYQKVGQKKPNPWGLYDMHGNVAEWCLDQYEPDFYEKFEDAAAANPWTRATKPYPHAVRGGSCDDEAAKLRSAARRVSDKSWKMQRPAAPEEHLVADRCPVPRVSRCAAAGGAFSGGVAEVLDQWRREGELKETSTQ